MFSLDEAALAYALVAERMMGEDAVFLNENPSTVPVFVSLLFQSLEISIKHVGIASGLFDDKEARRYRKGHGIQELAELVVERLHGKPFDPLIQALTFPLNTPGHGAIIRKMIHGAEFSGTRDAYVTRCLGYGEVREGDFAIIVGLEPWVSAVKQVAVNLPKIVSVVSQWKVHGSKSDPFVIWLGSHAPENQGSKVAMSYP